ncbi:heme-binding protein [Flavobacterium sp. ov086]|uniref:GlcG/HbpS family heme-binding protein n=1 Tax=Flavobacterium sp. ov086 TaxID=1761785 RepID=UPI000B684E8E|nr:heme-binding protein [Flavobacterium sp. ov086]SNR47575.1 glc operon protein GlcG [Flavobacterium sp. ov086]
MKDQVLHLRIALALSAIEDLIPNYMKIEEDKAISNGNVAICIIDEEGTVYGQMYGNDKARKRQSYKIAWTKASQVWLTGVKTGDYERLVFNKIVDENANGIEAPDLIGWHGGQPIILNDGTQLSVGFSGFRGTTDLEIVTKAFKKI